MKQSIRLRGISDEIKGQVWESDGLLRAGRLGSLEIVLDDSSVSRRHAEIRFHAPTGWVLRDLSSTNGTYLNGHRLTVERPLHSKEIVQFGKIALLVEFAETGDMTDNPTVNDNIHIDATASSSWEVAQQNLVYDKNHTLRPGEQLQALVQAAGHLNSIEKEDELLDKILHDAVHVLDAQRGAIVLADGPDNALQLKRLATGVGDPTAGRFHFSQNVAQRCFAKRESILCTSVKEDPELSTALSIADGAMSSVICALLRTPRRALGVLHLDRTLWQKPFTEDDLHLADALAAHVSAGIEASMLLSKQKELFLNTITVLAQLVESKDEYTGNHIKRVTTFAVMLGRHLGLRDVDHEAPADLERLETGTPLHDIGKIKIPDAILRKPGKLTPEEFEIMKTHTTEGAKVLENVPELHGIIPIVKHHHERWDGAGYPCGLKGQDIPLLARIVTVVDAFDAMTTDRPYMKARPPEVAFEELRKMAGKQFDPQCVAAFLAIQPQIIEAMKPEHQTAIVADPAKKKKDSQSNSGSFESAKPDPGIPLPNPMNGSHDSFRAVPS